VPTSADSVFFDQAGTYTVTMTGALNCLDITVSAGTVTFATGTGPTLGVYGSMSLLAGTVWNSTGAITFSATSGAHTITTNGVTINATNLQTGPTGGPSTATFTLGSALTLGSTTILGVASGTFDTSSSGNYTISTYQFSSNNTTARTINFNGSTVNISFPSNVAFNLATTTNLTFNAGTSQINLSGATTGIASGGLTFYNVSCTSVASTGVTITGANTFNNLTFTGRTTVGIVPVTFSANQTINGTLTVSAGTASAFRNFLASDTLGTTRTLTCAAVSLTDADFRDITIAGAAAPASGTRLGNCQGTSGITFPAAKTVYYRQTGSANWGATGSGSWSATSGGALDATQFPLAQDTAVFPAATYPASGSTTTINAAYNIGTIDMSLRTSNTMTLATGSNTPAIYGNWINGTGTTLTGTGRITFAARGSQTITSAGKTFTQGMTINSQNGSVTMQDALAIVSFTLTSGTFDAAGYNFTSSQTGSVGFQSTGTATRTLAIGSGTFSIASTGSPAASFTSTGLTVTGTGTISMTSASAKTFAGGGIQTYPTLNQGGTGTLTVAGSNRFAAITATTAGTVSLTSGTTNQVPLINTTGTATVTVNPTSTTATIRGSVRSSRAALTGPLVLGAS
jgi:hypothetical protein